MKNLLFIIFIFVLCSCTPVSNGDFSQNLLEEKSISSFTIERRSGLLLTDDKPKLVGSDLLIVRDVEPDSVSTENVGFDTSSAQSEIFDQTAFHVHDVASDSSTVQVDVFNRKLPDSVDIKMDFVPQAPFGDWSEPYDEACEEASMVMAKYALKNIQLTKKLMDKEIMDLVEWQNQTFGYYKDTTAQENFFTLKNFFKMDAIVVYDPTIDFIREKLASGNLILAHVSGRDLKNPHFHRPGPIYHVLVIRGYDKDGFITNDPGTRYGEAYHYSYDVIMNSLHDWNGGDVAAGRPVVLVVLK